MRFRHLLRLRLLLSQIIYGKQIKNNEQEQKQDGNEQQIENKYGDDQIKKISQSSEIKGNNQQHPHTDVIQKQSNKNINESSLIHPSGDNNNNNNNNSTSGYGSFIETFPYALERKIANEKEREKEIEKQIEKRKKKKQEKQERKEKEKKKKKEKKLLDKEKKHKHLNKDGDLIPFHSDIDQLEPISQDPNEILIEASEQNITGSLRSKHSKQSANIIRHQSTSAQSSSISTTTDPSTHRSQSITSSSSSSSSQTSITSITSSLRHPLSHKSEQQSRISNTNSSIHSSRSSITNSQSLSSSSISISPSTSSLSHSPLITIPQGSPLSCIRFGFLFSDDGAKMELLSSDHMRKWIPKGSEKYIFEGQISQRIFEKMLDRVRGDEEVFICLSDDNDEDENQDQSTVSNLRRGSQAKSKHKDKIRFRTQTKDKSREKEEKKHSSKSNKRNEKRHSGITEESSSSQLKADDKRNQNKNKDSSKTKQEEKASAERWDDVSTAKRLKQLLSDPNGTLRIKLNNIHILDLIPSKLALFF